MPLTTLVTAPVTEAQRDILAVFDANVVAIKLALTTASGYVLAWPNGLGVRFDADNKPFACGVVHAEIIVSEEQARTMPEEAWAYTPICRNGAGEQAQLVTQKRALEWALKGAETAIGQLMSYAYPKA